MKNVIKAFLAASLFSLLSCATGYVSSDGEILKPYLNPAELKALIESDQNEIWIIDVRPSSAYSGGHIPTARSYPSSVINEKLDELPRSKYLILYCETGGRAQMVIKSLEKEGYSRMMNWGGYTRWPYALVTE